MTLELRDIALPDRADEPGAVGDAFRARAAMLDALNARRFGGLVHVSLAERLVGARSTAHEAQELVGAYDGDRLVGTLTAWLSLSESTDVYDAVAEADASLDDREARAVHELLAEHAERRAAATGRGTRMAGTVGAASGSIPAATGHGGADADDPAVAPLVARGFALEQVYRVSALALDGLADLDARIASAERDAAGYRVLAWTGRVPDEHREDVRALHAGMSTDAPIGGLALEPETWDEARLDAFERRQDDGGRITLTVAAQHVASGAVAGFSTLFVLPTGHVASQHDTIVAAAHRGHRLGMLLKLANLARLAEHPRMTHVTTWNAEENRPMLAVNEAVGFAPIAYEAVWQRAPRREDAA